MTASPKSNLQERRLPVQARAQRRVQLILETTRALLREEGLASVTTTAIAAKASIPVSSVYQYYPNKKAIMMALYEDYLVKLREIFAEFDQPQYIDLGWESFTEKLFSAIYKAELRDEIENELEKALMIYPELEELDHQHRDMIADTIANMLKKLGSSWSRAKLRRLALYSYAINTGIWEYRAQAQPSNKELLEWNLSVIKAALGQCFE